MKKETIQKTIDFLKSVNETNPEGSYTIYSIIAELRKELEMPQMNLVSYYDEMQMHTTDIKKAKRALFEIEN